MFIFLAMLKLKHSIYNEGKRRDEPKLRLWKSLGLILTFKCNAACEFCYYSCNPQRGGLMSVEDAVNAWQGIVDISGSNAIVHISGGEPFLYFERMQEILEEATKNGLGGLDQVETNGYWATNEKIVRERIKFLDEHGMNQLKVSCDPYHQEYIEISLVRRLVRIAEEIIGPERVIVRWRRYLDYEKEDIDSMKEIYLKMLSEDPCRFTGRAAKDLANMHSNKTLKQISRWNCSRNIIGAHGVHIDPFGNIFNGVCSGIIVDNIKKKKLPDIWRNFDPYEFRFVDKLMETGPIAFISEAVGKGYVLKERYASKCHLCTELREFFFDNNDYIEIIGPFDCYG